MELKKVGLIGIVTTSALLGIDLIRAVAEQKKTGRFERPYELPLTALLIGSTLLYIFSKNEN